ncbi:MAG: hypothetical protein FWC22_02435 [Treponema sp.]|nr:hypothetical protein [Treponema sp.]
MSAQISFKNSLLMLLAGLFCAAVMVFLLQFLLAGPKLGMHYDFLQKYKKETVSREILIINTDEYIEGADIFSVLVTLTEMKASNMILAGKLSPSSSPITINETEVRRRFIDEYAVLGSNIRGLFEGIRMGSVTPVQAPLFVDQVIELSEQGRDRLIRALIDRDEDILRSIAVFGNFLQADTKPITDWDGKIRRVKLINEEGEHPVYGFLKNRYAVSQIETSDKRRILWLRGHNSSDIDITLDNDGNIIALGAASLRSMDIDVFRKYDELENVMRNKLEQANELKIFSQTPPDRIPLFLGDYADLLLNDLLSAPDSDNRYAWIAARSNYINSLREYFDSESEIFFINMYEDKIADTDPSNEDELNNLINAKNGLVLLSSSMRETFKEFIQIHDKLADELEMSLCIMGPHDNALYSALLSNTLITGSHTKPAQERSVYFWPFIAVFIILIIIFMMRPVILLLVGCILSALSAAAFSGYFIFFSYWIDPLISLGSSLTGIIIIFIIKCAYLNYRAGSFRIAYRAAVSKDVLRNLIKKGRPRLSEVKVCYASVIAIKDVNLNAKEENEKPQDAVKSRKIFYALAKRIIFSAGGVVAGFEGDTVLACFGSSLELKPVLTTYKWGEDGEPVAKTYHPAEKAYALVMELLSNKKISWHFAMDAGDCTFSWSPETGYLVSGRPAARARNLVVKTMRYNAKALMTNSVLERINADTDKIKILNDENGTFYELS